MGVMKFLLPSGLPGDVVQELQRASVAGGQDAMPYPAQVTLECGQMTVARNVDESGCLLVPWEVNGSGRVMSSSATLMERPQPYHLPIELARGKANQVRSQAADWIMGGLEMAPDLADLIRDATRCFYTAVAHVPEASATTTAQGALARCYEAADTLVRTYMAQVFNLRHQRQEKLDTTFGCRLPVQPEDGIFPTDAFNSICLQFPWCDIERTEGEFRWDMQDAAVEWALDQGLRLSGGPLIDFSGAFLPDWLWGRERDLSNLSGFLCNFVEAAVHRYRSKIRSWQIAAASNSAQVLAMSDEELLWLTVRLAEAARRVDPNFEIIVSIAQPWGEYLVYQERTHSPFVFADTLVRSGLKLSALDIEVVMGVSPGGSYCRDLLDLSRLLDLYALLGVPLQVTLAYPSGEGPDEYADTENKVGAGRWHEGFTPQVQAEWARSFAGLAVCKPYVRSVYWHQWSDAQPHVFPLCGLVDASGHAKPALECLREIRRLHLR
jgi:hypothetical protein